MIDAYVSGQAGRMIVVDGNDAFVIDADDLNRKVAVPFALALNALGKANDVVELKSVKRTEATERLRFEWLCDRSLRLLLILMDGDEYVEIKEEAARVLKEMIVLPEVRDFTARHIYAYPIPISAAAKSAIELAGPGSELSSFLMQLLERQSAVAAYRDAWSRLPDDIFENAKARSRINNYLIDSGAFRDLVFAGNNADMVNATLFKCFVALKNEKNHREIITRWTKDAPRARQQAPQDEPRSSADGDEFWDDQPEAHQQNHRSTYEEFQNVLKQQEAIVEQLRRANIALATRYTDDLIQHQLRGSEPSFAAKSLCRLAQEAKRLGCYSVQLAWARRASEIAPEDSWAHGQTADAYICLSRYEDAARSLQLAEIYGDRLFAANGRARILRAQAKLDEALAAFIAIEQEYSDTADVEFSWLGHAEVLRDMWLFEAALEVYEKTIAKFPNFSAAHCGRAAVLTDMGRLSEALRGYEDAIRLFGNEPYALNGRADVWKEMGRFDDALAAYEKIKDLYPFNSVPYCGFAEVLKLRGDLAASLKAYREARQKFPCIPVTYSGEAEVLKEQRTFDDALAVYDAAIAKFPFDARCRNGKANVLKSAGRLKESLATYDENTRLFPYDLIGVNGRADLLKELGDFSNAIELYDRLITKWPGFRSAKYAKAAILVALERYEEARALLPTEPPQTSEEWIAFHIDGMILLRTGRIEEAITHLTRGLIDVPFARERRFFRNALAIAKLRKREYGEVVGLLDRAMDPVGNVLRLHALVGSGRAHEAHDTLRQLEWNCPPKLVDLRNELAKRSRLPKAATLHEDAWIFNQECEGALLLAA